MSEQEIAIIMTKLNEMDDKLDAANVDIKDIKVKQESEHDQLLVLKTNFDNFKENYIADRKAERDTGKDFNERLEKLEDKTRTYLTAGFCGLVGGGLGVGIREIIGALV